MKTKLIRRWIYFCKENELSYDLDQVLQEREEGKFIGRSATFFLALSINLVKVGLEISISTAASSCDMHKKSDKRIASYSSSNNVISSKPFAGIPEGLNLV